MVRLSCCLPSGRVDCFLEFLEGDPNNERVARVAVFLALHHDYLDPELEPLPVKLRVRVEDFFDVAETAGLLVGYHHERDSKYSAI
jgi:hypothetical protein